MMIRYFGYLALMLCSVAVLSDVSGAQTRPTVKGEAGVGDLPQVTDPPRGTSASNANSGKQTITLVKDSTIHYLILSVAEQANLQAMFYGGEEILQKKVSVNIRGLSVNEAFREIVKGTKLNIRILSDGKSVVVSPEKNTGKSLQSPGAGQKYGRVVGSVIDSSTAKGLLGVTVTLVGIKLTTVTDQSGKFEIKNVPEGEYVINLRSIGYATRTQSIMVPSGGDVNVAVIMIPSASILSGVVTTATGQQRKLDVVNDVSKLDVQEVLKNNPVSNVSDLLATRVPGLQAVKTSGAPGAPTRIRIRGVSSINTSNDPIIIVDGIQIHSEANLASTSNSGPPLSPLDQIDVNSIESVEVLKGASAVAIYGSDAANGVIVITTKRGKTGETPRWNTRVKYATETMPGRWPDNYYAWGTSKIFGGEPQVCPLAYRSPATGCRVDSVSLYQVLNDKSTTIFGTGKTIEVGVGAQGGIGNSAYSILLTKANQIGLVKVPDLDASLMKSRGKDISEFNRRPQRNALFGINSSLDLSISELSRVGFNFSISQGTRRNSPLTLLIPLSRNLLPPQWERSDDGEIHIVATALGLLESDGRGGRFKETQVDRVLTIRPSVQAQSDLFSSAIIRTGIGLDILSTSGQTLLRNGDCFNIICGISVLDSGYILASSGLSRMWNANMVITGKVRGWRLISVTPLMGFNINSSRSEMFSLQGYGLRAASNDYGSAERTNATSDSDSKTTAGGYGELQLRIMDRISIPLAMRRDAGSSLGASIAPVFPKLGFAYAISENESFQQIPLIGNIPVLKIRSAYGVAGKQPAGYQKYRSYVDNGVESGIVINDNIGNLSLKPERSVEYEYGLDTDFISTDRLRISSTLSVYTKKTKDLIVDEGVAYSLGGYGQTVNLGDVLNKGIEGSLDSYFHFDELQWQSTILVSKNDNKLLRLGHQSRPVEMGDPTGRIPDVLNRHVVGYPLNGRWAKTLVGFQDQDGNGIIDASEVILSDQYYYTGAPYPKLQLNSTQQISFMNSLIVSVVVGYDHGLTQVTPVSNRVFHDTALSLRDQAYGAYSPMSNVQTTSSFRIESAQLTFNVPSHLTKKMIGRHSVSISIHGTNLLLLSNYRGKDPKVGVIGETIADDGALPVARTIGLQLNLR